MKFSTGAFAFIASFLCLLDVAVHGQEGDAIWWESLPEAQQTKLTSLFESNWFQNDIDEDKRIAYAYSAQQIYDFLATNKDSSPNDSYVGFAPLLLRASFHGAGSYTHATGTGGSNGGTIFNHAELADAQNGCIAGATTELFDLFHGQENVPLADTVVIAGVVALDSMDVSSTRKTVSCSNVCCYFFCLTSLVSLLLFHPLSFLVWTCSRLRVVVIPFLMSPIAIVCLRLMTIH